ncbi:MAG: metallophosphoesterase [Bacteroidales bacterium]|jgi:predicted MPP superfamily phosphohydrolase|nr:metallophosphoesterase [Bacteroidales bacterium]
MEFLRTAVLIIVFLALDWLAFKGVRFAFPLFFKRRQRRIHRFFVVQAVFMLAVVGGGAILQQIVHDYRMVAVYYYFFAAVLMLYGSKMAFLTLLVPDIFFSWRYHKKRGTQRLHSGRPPHRWAKAGVIFGILLIFLMVWGIVYGRHNFHVNRVELAFDDLPEQFDGFRILQISDLHTGSFLGDYSHFAHLADSITLAQADLIVCTGDFVNFVADELLPIIPYLAKLEAPCGKLAILGNHDYGAYFKWKTAADSTAHQRTLEHNIALTGFNLLKNSAVTIEKDSLNRIAIVGVENWGTRKRKKYPRRADIATATASVSDIPFKILLSHDPTFWQMHIQGKSDIQLTLSGHTHGTQMGVKLGKFKFSPAQIMYPYWAGLYEVNHQYLYVNNGVGVIGFPGRIGMPPEITIFTLKRK